MDKKLEFNSKYNSRILFDEDSSINNILVSYYLPLIKPNAYSLYMFLSIESKNLATNSIFKSVDRIIAMLNLSVDEINKSLERLELVNLIEIFINKKNQFVFKLNRPLSPIEFNNSKQFKELLKSKISLENFEINNKLFNSLKLNDNFNLKPLTSELNISIDNERKFKNKLNVNADFQNIKYILNAKGIDWSKFWTKEVEEKLLTILVLYKINNFDIAVELISSYETKKFNIDEVVKKITTKKLEENNFENILNINDNFIESKLNLLKDLEVKDFIFSKLNRKPLESEKKFIVKLTKDYGFNNYIINILIDFSLLVNDGILSENYILKISNTLVKQKIDTPENLISYLRDTYKLKTKGKTKSSLDKNKLMDEIPTFD